MEHYFDTILKLKMVGNSLENKLNKFIDFQKF